MADEWVIGIGVLSLLVGLGIGYLISARGARKAKVAQLEGALVGAQQELSDYKREVFGQFAGTAEKFRALDKSYNDLHKQLAESSIALCGDAGSLLLESTPADALKAADEEIVVSEASASSAEADQEAGREAEGEVDASAPPSPLAQEAPPAPGAATDADHAEPVAAAVDDATASADKSAPRSEAADGIDAVRGEDATVPILTEVEADAAAPRRESA